MSLLSRRGLPSVQMAYLRPDSSEDLGVTRLIHSSAKFFSSRRPGSLALLGVELRGEEVVAPDHRAERVGVDGLAGDDVVVAAARRSTSGRSRSARRRRCPRRSAGGGGAATRVPAHVRHLVLARDVEAAHFAGERCRGPRARRLRSRRRTAVAGPGRCRGTACPRRSRRGSARRVAAAELGDRVGEGADAGQHELVGLGEHVADRS